MTNVKGEITGMTNVGICIIVNVNVATEHWSNLKMGDCKIVQGDD